MCDTWRARHRAPFVALALATAVSISGCLIDADYEATSFACEVSGECPPDFACTGGQCVPVGASDAASPGDDAGGQLADGGIEPSIDAEVDLCGDPEPIAAVADEFGGPDVDPRWRVETGGGATATVSGDQAVFELSKAGGAEGLFESRCGYDLDGARAFIEVAEAPGAGGGAFFEVLATGDTGDELSFTFHNDFLQGDSLSMRGSIGGSPTATESIRFNPVAHRYLAISTGGGSAEFETSPDGVAWVVEHTVISGVDRFADARVRFGLRATEAGQAGTTTRYERVAGGAR